MYAQNFQGTPKYMRQFSNQMLLKKSKPRRIASHPFQLWLFDVHVYHFWVHLHEKEKKKK